MKALRGNIIVHLGIFGFLVMLFVPSLIKLNHVFENEQHVICAGASESHFHEIDHECDFKLKQSHTFVFDFTVFEAPADQISHQLVVQLEEFTSFYQPLFYQLRAPPVLV